MANMAITTKSVASIKSRQQDHSISLFVLRKAKFLTILVFLFLALFHVWISFKTLSLGMAITAENRHWEQLLQENQKLRLELSSLSGPERIHNISSKLLNMRYPEKSQFVIIGESDD